MKHLHRGADALVGLLDARIQTDVDAIVNVLSLTQRLFALLTRCRRRIPIAQIFLALGAYVWSEIVYEMKIKKLPFSCRFQWPKTASIDLFERISAI